MEVQIILTVKIFWRIFLFVFVFVLSVLPAKNVYAEVQASEIINNFAFKAAGYLIQNSNADEGENFFFSPFSIISAFGMLYSGASGDTLIEMENALKFDHSLNKNLGALAEELNKRKLLFSANRIWVDEEFKLRNNYQAVLHHYYKSGAQRVDFKNDPDGAKDIINQWVSDRTNGKIQNLINDIGQATKMILTNAVYFNSRWEKPFNKELTAEKPFNVSSEIKTNVKMMMKHDDFLYGEFDGNKIIKLPYENYRTSLIAILPADNLKSTLENLTPETFSKMLNSLTNCNVDLWLPKFKVENKYELRSMLKSLGVELAFSDEADFSRITADEDEKIKVDAVIHQTFLEIDEEKTEAAAATGIIMVGVTAMPEEKRQVEFHADRPFLYFRIDNSTNSVLFAGAQSFK